MCGWLVRNGEGAPRRTPIDTSHQATTRGATVARSTQQVPLMSTPKQPRDRPSKKLASRHSRAPWVLPHHCSPPAWKPTSRCCSQRSARGPRRIRRDPHRFELQRPTLHDSKRPFCFGMTHRDNMMSDLLRRGVATHVRRNISVVSIIRGRSLQFTQGHAAFRSPFPSSSLISKCCGGPHIDSSLSFESWCAGKGLDPL